MPDAELQAMDTVHAALDPLDDDARQRVLSWVSERLGIDGGRAIAPEIPGGGGGPTRSSADGMSAGFDEVADLMHVAQPSSGPERALAVAYWFQEIRSQPTWSGSDINTTLRNLGEGLSNVTRTLDGLKARSPSLVMQVSKTGKSKQGRKTYKLTTAGVRAVTKMLGDGAEETD